MLGLTDIRQTLNFPEVKWPQSLSRWRTCLPDLGVEQIAKLSTIIPPPTLETCCIRFPVLGRVTLTTFVVETPLGLTLLNDKTPCLPAPPTFRTVTPRRPLAWTVLGQCLLYVAVMVFMNPILLVLLIGPNNNCLFTARNRVKQVHDVFGPPTTQPCPKLPPQEIIPLATTCLPLLTARPRPSETEWTLPRKVTRPPSKL